LNFYIDEPQIILNNSTFNSTVGIKDTNYDKLNCTVKTVGAPYKLEIHKETDLKDIH
jgi:hypothetical protein